VVGLLRGRHNHRIRAVGMRAFIAAERKEHLQCSLRVASIKLRSCGWFLRPHSHGSSVGVKSPLGSCWATKRANRRLDPFTVENRINFIISEKNENQRQWPIL